MGHQRKLVTLRNLKIIIEELKIDTKEKQSFIDLINQAIGEVTKGIVNANFFTKVGFIKTLLEKIKKG